MASRKDGALYIGVTSDLMRRVYEHKEGLADGHTKKYNIKHLVYFEMHGNAESSITRETQMKAWKRQWKIELIEKQNPDWQDVYAQII